MQPVQPQAPEAVSLTVIHPQAAGWDIGREEIGVAVPPPSDPQPVRKFGTLTPDRQALANGLCACGVTTVAMESTGVRWIPIDALLPAQGFKPDLVNARHSKKVPGRKRAVKDGQWSQRLHRDGVLSNAFRPEAELVIVRADLRQRADRIEHRAAQIQPRQTALPPMNLPWTQGLKASTGVTGRQSIRAIVAGARHPVTLAQLRDHRCKHSSAAIATALTGNYRAAPRFALKQALRLYDADTAQIADCDVAIERQFSARKPTPDDERPPLDRSQQPDTPCKHGPRSDARERLYQKLGVDRVGLDGWQASRVETLLRAVGTRRDAWPAVKPFCAGLHWAPHNDLSGGQGLRARVLTGGNRAGQVFRLAARSVGQTDTAFGACYRRRRAQHGPKQALVATAHQLARTFYLMLKNRQPDQRTSAEVYTARERERAIARFTKKAHKLGFELVRPAPQPVAS